MTLASAVATLNQTMKAVLEELQGLRRDINSLTEATYWAAGHRAPDAVPRP